MTVSYNDIFFRTAISLVATHMVVTYAVPETFFQLLIMPEYYYSMAGSYIIALMLSYTVYKVTVRLDMKYNWEEKPVLRTTFQLIFGFLLPGILAFLLAFVYFSGYGMKIFKTSYLRFDYPVILLLLFILNLYYLAYYFYLRMRQEKAERIRLADTKQSPSVFIVNQGIYNLPVPIEQVAYFFREETFNFLRTVNGNDHALPPSLSLDEIQADLSEDEFFRANRQYLISRRSWRKFETLQYHKLKVHVEPAPNTDIIISQKRNRAFKDWIKA